MNSRGRVTSLPGNPHPRGLGKKRLLVSRVDVDSAFLRTNYPGRFAPGLQLEGSAPCQK